MSKDSKQFFDKGLEKTKTSFFSKLGKLVLGKSKIDDDVLDQLEEILITSDVGVSTTLKIIKGIEQTVAKEKYFGNNELTTILKNEVKQLICGTDDEQDIDKELMLKKPYVIMVVGVNGVGKTTTIGKLASKFKKNGLKVLLGAADTFRAAAVDQLKLWGNRVDVPVIAKNMNTSPSAVAFDTIKHGVENNYDVVIIDTAGRLHNKVNLMNELTKIKNVMQKFVDTAPHDVMLVLDGSTGQNAINQAKEFSKSTNVTSLAITKLDGTAKGGVVIGISDELNIPIKYIGVGEQIQDLISFNKNQFVDSLFDSK